MSQYYTYDNLTGRLPMDSIQLDPSCKTCTGAKCYSYFNVISGVSSSRYDSYASTALSENDRTPLPAPMCDVSMLKCNGTPINNPDPYGINVNSPVACPVKPSSYQIDLPQMSGSLDTRRAESPRNINHRSTHNSSRTSSNVVRPVEVRPVEVRPVVVKPVPVKLSVSSAPSVKLSPSAKPVVKQVPVKLSPATSSSKPTSSVSKPTSSVSKPIVKPVSVKLSPATSASKPTTSASKPTTSASKPAQKVPVVLPVSPKRKSSIGSLLKRLE